jgi:hypothetical protein
MNRRVWPAKGREETRIKAMNVEAFLAMKGAKHN